MIRGLVLALFVLFPALAAAEAPDRKAPPPVVPPNILTLPAPQVYTLKPGVLVHLVPVAGFRKARIDVVFRRGELEIDGRPSPAVESAVWLWDQETRRTSADELAAREAMLDGDVWTEGDLQYSAAHLDVPQDDLDAGLALLREVITEPRYRKDDVRMLRDAKLRWVFSEGPTLSSAILDAGFAHAWYPAGHALDERPDVQGWRSLRAKHLADRHRKVIAAGPIDVMVVADLTWEELRPRLEALLEGLGGPGDLPAVPEYEPPTTRRVVAVDLGNTDQLSFGLGFNAPSLDHPDAGAFRALDFAVGGSFLSRLNKVLREEKGLTYGIGSTWSVSMYRGRWTVYSQVAVKDGAEALQAVEDVLAGVAADGLTDDEVRDSATDAVAGWNTTFSSPARVAETYGSLLRHRQDATALRSRLDAVRDTTPAETLEVARRWLGEDAGRMWILVGDRSLVEKQLETLGWKAEWMPSELVLLGSPRPKPAPTPDPGDPDAAEPDPADPELVPAP
jgi:predicted Zn-dependent peptidase